MGRVIHFDLPASDPERAIAFYKLVFGWQFQKWAGPVDYWLVTTGAEAAPGINGGIQKRNDKIRSTTNTIAVDSLDHALAAVAKAGGVQTVPRMPIPGSGYLAYCEDTEGNAFGLMELDPTAK